MPLIYLVYVVIAGSVISLYSCDSVSSSFSVDEHFWQQLADENSSLKVVEEYIQAGQHLLIRDNTGSTFLHYAARFGNRALAKKLLEYKADPNIFNARGETPLHEAVMGNNEELVLLLIRAGATVHYHPHVRNKNYESPWSRAIRHNKACFFRCLIAYGCCVDFDKQEEKAAFDEAFGNAQGLLWYALESRNTRGIEYALSLGAHIDAYNEKLSIRPLEYAIMHDHADSALVLLRHGAQVHKIDFYVRDPMRQAYVYKAYKVVPLLIAYGALLSLDDQAEVEFVYKAIPNELERAVIYDRRDKLLEIISRFHALRRRSLPPPVVSEALPLSIQRRCSVPPVRMTEKSQILSNSATNERRALAFAVGRMNKYLVMKVLDLISYCNPCEAFAVFNTIRKRADSSLKLMQWYKQIKILLMVRILLFKSALKEIFEEAAQNPKNPISTLPEELLLSILGYAFDPVIISCMCNPLCDAIQTHDSDIAKWLLQKKFSAIDGLYSSDDDFGQTVNMFISSDSIPSLSGSTLLHYAVAHSCNSTRIVRLLISHGALPDTQESSTGQTALHKACAGFATDIVQFLLEHGAHITRDKEGKTPQNIANHTGAHFCAIIIERWLTHCEDQEREYIETVDKKSKKHKEKKYKCVVS